MTKKKNISKSAFQIEYALLCEGVRKEITGKDIIIGAVPDGLMVAKFPAVVACCFWVVTQAFELPVGMHTVELRLREKKNENAKVFSFQKLTFQVSSVAGGRAAFSTNVIPVEIDSPFRANLEYSFDGGDFVNIRDVEFIEIPGVS